MAHILGSTSRETHMDRLFRLVSVTLIGLMLASCASKPKDPEHPTSRRSAPTASSAECMACKSTGLRMADCDEPYARCTARCPKLPNGPSGGVDMCSMNCTMEHSRCISNASVPNCPRSCR
jgi:hypothetical protein